MRVHHLENDLITLNPSNFKSLNEFFTKFKNLIYQLNKCKVEKEDDQLILSSLSKLSANYSVSMSTFQSVRITTPNWKIPTLDAFIVYLTYEHDKLIQMGIIRSSRDQALVVGGPKGANDKGKQRDKSPVKKEQSNEPSSSKRRKKNGKANTLFSYYGWGFHLEISYMRRTIDEMTILLEKHNITILAGTRKVEHREETKEHDERFYAMKANCSTIHAFLIDSGASIHMVASKESFSSLQYSDGPSIQIGNNSQIRAKGKGSIKLEHGKFKDVLLCSLPR